MWPECLLGSTDQATKKLEGQFFFSGILKHPLELSSSGLGSGVMVLVLTPDVPALSNAQIFDGIDLVKDVLTFIPSGDARVNSHPHAVQPPEIVGLLAGRR